MYVINYRKTEQLSVVLRYFFSWDCLRKFCGICPNISDLTAQRLSSQIVSQLEKMQLDYQNMLVWQDHDGASAMSGQQKGVAKIIKDKAHYALYVHCHAHRLNLALVDAVKSV